MLSFQWGEYYLTGLVEVDEQHQYLVDLINNLGQQLLNNDISITELEGLVLELASYAAHHFKEEEQMMLAHNIDSRHYNKHRAVHNRFLMETSHLVNDLTLKGRSAAKQLFDYLVQWLTYHILGSDQDMARQIASISKGINPADAYKKEERERDQSTSVLLEALNRLFELVSQRNKELTDLNLTLESKVKQRTEELNRANEHLQALSNTDVLTRLPNRRYAMNQLTLHWEFSCKQGVPLSCIMIDADYFKEVNDSYGHDAGDIVLKTLAQTLTDAVRTDDIVCRLGGDEFLVICVNTDKAGVEKVAENLSQKVAALKVEVNGGQWLGSVSIGVATKKENNASYEILIQEADKALYRAKSDGRSCIRFA